MLKLRPYQQEVLENARVAVDKYKVPFLLMASVGSGKSVMMAEIAKYCIKKKMRILMLAHSVELVRNNAEAFKTQTNQTPSIYNAALGQKQIHGEIVFSTPFSFIKLCDGEKVKPNDFHAIIIDEAHMVAYKNEKNTYMRLVNYFKNAMIIGATGTNFRYRGESIVGDNCLFKKQICDISLLELIQKKYLARPRFSINEETRIDFTGLRLSKNNMFNKTELKQTTRDNITQTALIMQALVQVVTKENRNGAFVFAVDQEHCRECLKFLPDHEAAIIIDSTSYNERCRLLNKARRGEIKYLINVSVLTVGIDVPLFDTACFVRPTESLVLFVQMMGRVLRLHPQKKDALVLDCAGNIERHKHYANPELFSSIEMLASNDKIKTKECPSCGVTLPATARKCNSFINVGDKSVPCEHVFYFKPCSSCFYQNDISARRCKNCNTLFESVTDNFSIEPFITKIKEDFSTLEEITVDYASCIVYKRNNKLSSIIINYYERSDDNKLLHHNDRYTSQDQSLMNFYYNFLQFFSNKNLIECFTWQDLKNPDTLVNILKNTRLPLKIYKRTDETPRKLSIIPHLNHKSCNVRKIVYYYTEELQEVDCGKTLLYTDFDGFDYDYNTNLLGRKYYA